MAAPGNLIQFWPNSGAMSLVPFEETVAETGGTSEAHLGPDGVAQGMTIRVPWRYLRTACQQILGFSYRDTKSGVPILRRKIPWQHPYFNQLYAKSISSVKGEISQGNSTQQADFKPAEGGFGTGDSGPNFGPWSVFKFALLTIQFWRPPYAIRTDTDIVAPTGPLAGLPQEWLRYFSPKWELNVQMLSREGSKFIYAAGQGQVTGQPFVGSIGQVVGHERLTRTWYEVPATALFTQLPDGTPNGIPALQFMKTPTTNPVTGYVQNASNVPGNAGFQAFTIMGCVNSPIGGGINETFPDMTDLRFLGCSTGTLRLDAIEIRDRPLQLPPDLMKIGVISNNEPIAQLQYDVVFHFDRFDPPRSPRIIANTASIIGGQVLIANSVPATNVPPTAAITSGPINQVYRGHNLMPFQDGTWYMAHSQLVPLSANPATVTTAFQYAAFEDLLTII